MKPKTVKLSRKTLEAIRAVDKSERKHESLKNQVANMGKKILSLTIAANKAARADAIKSGLKNGSKVWFFTKDGRISGHALDITMGRDWSLEEDRPMPVVMVKTLDTMPLTQVRLKGLYLERPSLRLRNLR